MEIVHAKLDHVILAGLVAGGAVDLQRIGPRIEELLQPLGHSHVIAPAKGLRAREHALGDIAAVVRSSGVVGVGPVHVDGQVLELTD